MIMKGPIHDKRELGFKPKLSASLFPLLPDGDGAVVNPSPGADCEDQGRVLEGLDGLGSKAFDERSGTRVVLSH